MYGGWARRSCLRACGPGSDQRQVPEHLLAHVVRARDGIVSWERDGDKAAAPGGRPEGLDQGLLSVDGELGAGSPRSESTWAGTQGARTRRGTSGSLPRT